MKLIVFVLNQTAARNIDVMYVHMVTSRHGNAFRITGLSWRQSSGHWWMSLKRGQHYHYNDVIMGAIASQVTSLTSVYSTIYSSADQRKHQSSASLAFVRGIHRWPVNSPHKGSITRKMFPFDDVIMCHGSKFVCWFVDTLGKLWWLPCV